MTGYLLMVRPRDTTVRLLDRWRQDADGGWLYTTIKASLAVVVVVVFFVAERCDDDIAW